MAMTHTMQKIKVVGPAIKMAWNRTDTTRFYGFIIFLANITDCVSEEDNKPYLRDMIEKKLNLDESLVKII